jgi:hypothetical protein
MAFLFVGGPYDGMEIDHELINRHTSIIPVSGDLGTRLFVLMPPREQWDALIHSGPPVREGVHQLYERVFDSGGAHFELALPDALAQAQLEATLKVHPRARTALSALPDVSRRAVVQAVSALQTTHPEQWPGNSVSRLSPDKPLYLVRATPELRAFVRALEPKGVELLDVVRENTLRLFLERQRSGSPVG